MGGSLLPTGRDLAATYTGGHYTNPLEVYEQYFDAIEYHKENPDATAWKIAQAAGTKRSRVRPWLEDGAMPAPVRAVYTAERLGWLPLSFEREAFDSLNILVAGVYSGGSINSQWVPMWHLDSEYSEKLFTSTIESLGTDWRVQRRDQDHRATEILPTEHGSLLGRMLYILGAPKGPKSHTTDLDLPAYLDYAPDRIKRDWVTVYCRLRGTVYPEEGRQGSWLRVHEERRDGYYDALVQLISSLLPYRTGIRVKRSGDGIHLSREAVEELFGTDRPDVEQVTV